MPTILGSVTAIPDDLQPGFGQLFSKYINVFGVNIVARSSIPDAKVAHVANILAQYLDNDEDGQPDDKAVRDELYNRYATLLLFEDRKDADHFFKPTDIRVWLEYLNLFVAGAVGNYKEILALDIVPKSKALDANFHGEGLRGDTYYDEDQFDKTLEETLHLITHTGVARTYSDAFGEGLIAHAAGTGAVSEMNFLIDDLNGDCGSGYWKDYTSPGSEECNGHFARADADCTYNCIQQQGLYWTLTSLLGAHNYTARIEEVKDEWTMCDPALVRSNATELVSLLQRHSKYDWLPRKLPDGQYSGELPKFAVHKITDYAPYIVAALIAFVSSFCTPFVIELKAKSSRHLTRGMSSVSQRTGLSIVDSGGEKSGSKRDSKRSPGRANRHDQDTRGTMDTRGTIGDSMASTKSAASTTSAVDMRRLQKLEAENKRLKKVEQENRKLRERVKEHEELFTALDEVEFEEMDEEAPIPLNQRASEAIS
ncbi:hypothetical protein TL16_g02768 [Triparma laevis f. inornata]|uniref:Uncharacterized protein n=1 Tax=Triparma laevis f. inornata TaxID=1714386 RepID=A0A9W6ZXX5_9STRA|nr:hypothetical protein TL16_g02768 [Triparma laevis f. inornata]